MNYFFECFFSKDLFIFFILSILFFLIGFKFGYLLLYKLSLIKNNKVTVPEKTVNLSLNANINTNYESATNRTPIYICFSEELIQTFDTVQMLKDINLKRQELIKMFGIDMPIISDLVTRPNMQEYLFTIDIDRVPVAEYKIRKDMLIVFSSHEILEKANIPHEIIAPIGNNRKKFHVALECEDMLKDIGIPYLIPKDAILEQVSTCMQLYFARFISMEETQKWINDAKNDLPTLVTESYNVIGVERLTEVFKRLLNDQISLAARRPLLEAIVKWAGREEDAAMLVELIRVSIRRQICFTCADQSKIIIAAIFAPSVEEVIRQSVRRTNMGDFLALEPDMADKVMEHIKNIVHDPRFMNMMPVILCSIDTRRFIRSYLLSLGIDILLLSQQDIAEDFRVQVIYTIK